MFSEYYIETKIGMIYIIYFYFDWFYKNKTNTTLYKINLKYNLSRKIITHRDLSRILYFNVSVIQTI